MLALYEIPYRRHGKNMSKRQKWPTQQNWKRARKWDYFQRRNELRSSLLTDIKDYLILYLYNSKVFFAREYVSEHVSVLVCIHNRNMKQTKIDLKHDERQQRQDITNTMFFNIEDAH